MMHPHTHKKILPSLLFPMFHTLGSGMSPVWNRRSLYLLPKCPLMHISNQHFESHLFSLHSICPKSIYFVHHYCYPSDSAPTIVHLDHGSSLLTGLSCSLSSLPTTHDSTQRGNVNTQVCIGVPRIPPTLHLCPVTQNLEDRRVRNPQTVVQECNNFISGHGYQLIMIIGTLLNWIMTNNGHWIGGKISKLEQAYQIGIE